MTDYVHLLQDSDSKLVQNTPPPAPADKQPPTTP